MKIKKLLDTNGGNSKLEKTNRTVLTDAVVKVLGGDKFRYAGLSLFPDDVLCAGSKAAACQNPCLESSGRGNSPDVRDARKAKAAWFKSAPEAFLAQLRVELANFAKLCERQGLKPVVRLNVISDVDWTRYGIPQQFPQIQFIDYTKIPARLKPGYLPDNYRLIFSYSGVRTFAKSVAIALDTGAPVAVVFRGDVLPETFLGRDVIDGDRSDLLNAYADGMIVGLRAKGKAKKDTGGFVVDPDVIAVAA
jgi:hypothetical protein